MAETNRSWPGLSALLADNSSGDISPQDLRDALYSLSQIWGGMHVLGGSTTTATAADNSWVTVDLADFTDDSRSVGIVPDKANDRITLPAVAGIYMVALSATIEGGTNSALWGLRFTLDGSEISGGTFEPWRPFVANVGHFVNLSFPIIYDGAGSGHIQLQVRKQTPSSSFLISSGGIWVYRVG